MSTASDIELYDKIQLAYSFNLHETMPHVRRLFQYRKELARRIMETGYDNEAYIDLFKINGEQIKQIIGL